MHLKNRPPEKCNRAAAPTYFHVIRFFEPNLIRTTWRSFLPPQIQTFVRVPNYPPYFPLDRKVNAFGIKHLQSHVLILLTTPSVYRDE
jgi:hypothetical protein